MRKEKIQLFYGRLARSAWTTAKGIAVMGTALIGLAVIAPQKAHAIFGLGDVVFDPSTWAETVSIWSQDVSTFTKITEEVTQMTKIYNNALQMYTLADTMAHSFNGAAKGQWLTLAQMAVADHTSDLASAKGENGPWSKAMDGDPASVPAAWKAATVGLKALGPLMAPQPLGSRLTSTMATINAMDGSSMKCMQTIAQYRGNSLVNQLGPVLKLAIQHFDGTAATNAEVQQLNLMNGHADQSNREARAQGQMQTCLIESQIVALKAQRDQITQSLNFQADALADQSVYNPYGGNVSGTLAAHIPM